MEKVVAACKRLRICLVESEYQIHDALAKELEADKIGFKKEVMVAPGSRIDFLCDNGVGIEVKKGKPNSRKLAAQAARYLKSEKLNGLILLVERSVYQYKKEIYEKPVVYIALSKLWGIAL